MPLAVVTLTGVPVRIPRMPFNCHPPNTNSSGRSQVAEEPLAASDRQVVQSAEIERVPHVEVRRGNLGIQIVGILRVCRY